MKQLWKIEGQYKKEEACTTNSWEADRHLFFCFHGSQVGALVQNILNFYVQPLLFYTIKLSSIFKYFYHLTKCRLPHDISYTILVDSSLPQLPASHSHLNIWCPSYPLPISHHMCSTDYFGLLSLEASFHLLLGTFLVTRSTHTHTPPQLNLNDNWETRCIFERDDRIFSVSKAVSPLSICFPVLPTFPINFIILIFFLSR